MLSNSINLMSFEMDLRGYSDDTKRHYLYHIRCFSEFFNQSPELLDESHVRTFLHHLITGSYSFSMINTTYSAIKFLFVQVFHLPWNIKNIPRPKQSIILPKYLSFDEVRSVLLATHNLKHRAILSTVYSSGLRVSEVVNLKISDILSPSMQVFISQGKGRKDRYTVLSQQNLFLLREYFRQYKPSDYLFPNQLTNKPLSTRTVQVVFKESLRAANIKRDLSVHALRHSFATHLLQNNVDIYFISQLLGHSNIETTAIYLHLVHKDLSSVPSPLDSFLEGGLL